MIRNSKFSGFSSLNFSRFDYLNVFKFNATQSYYMSSEPRFSLSTRQHANCPTTIEIFLPKFWRLLVKLFMIDQLNTTLLSINNIVQHFSETLSISDGTGLIWWWFRFDRPKFHFCHNSRLIWQNYN